MPKTSAVHFCCAAGATLTPKAGRHHRSALSEGKEPKISNILPSQQLSGHRHGPTTRHTKTLYAIPQVNL